MIDRWVGRDVDLDLLSQRFELFFDEKKFPSKPEKGRKNEYLITVILKHMREVNATGNVKVVVRGEPNDFEVEFVASFGSRNLAKLSGLAALFGGGMLVLKDLKSSEELEKLENEFWLFADKQVDSLEKKKNGK